MALSSGDVRTLRKQIGDPLQAYIRRVGTDHSIKLTDIRTRKGEFEAKTNGDWFLVRESDSFHDGRGRAI